MTPPVRTVLIEDHRIYSEGLTRLLTLSDHFTVVAQVFDSRRACETCARLQPELVLVDYNMPHLDGLAVVEQLRQLPQSGRIVVISLYADQAKRARLRALNVDGYLAKTLPTGRLLALLDRVMQGEPIFESDMPNEEPPPVPDHFGLRQQFTKREVEILKGIKRGLTTGQVATALGLSYFTVHTHRKNISRKLPFLTQQELYEFLETLTG